MAWLIGRSEYDEVPREPTDRMTGLTGDVDGWNTEIEPRPLVAKSSWDDEEGNMDRCHQCGRDGRGDLDQTDGNFYCNSCWGAFEFNQQLRTSQPVTNAKHHVRGGGGADIPA